MKHKVLFINRDCMLMSTFTQDGQTSSIAQLEIEPNIIPALLVLQEFGFRIIIIINKQDDLIKPNVLSTNGNNQHNLLLNIFTSQGIIFTPVLRSSLFMEDNSTNKNINITAILSLLKMEMLDKLHSYVIGQKEIDMKLADNIGISYLQYQRDTLNWQVCSKKLTKIDRYACISRTTKETTVNVKVWLDQENNSLINTGIGFFDHMLNQIAIHGGLSMHIQVSGDLHIDDHHTVEDTALALGTALKKALGNKHGINRFGFVLPMDECLTRCALDISGRPYLQYNAVYNYQRVGDLSTEMVEHFFRSLSYTMACTLHLKTKGKNDHHLVESLFKAFGRTLRQAIHVEGNTLPSSKGVL